jgi:hypothetical protein
MPTGGAAGEHGDAGQGIRAFPGPPPLETRLSGVRAFGQPTICQNLGRMRDPACGARSLFPVALTTPAERPLPNVFHNWKNECKSCENQPHDPISGFVEWVSVYTRSVSTTFRTGSNLVSSAAGGAASWRRLQELTHPASRPLAAVSDELKGGIAIRQDEFNSTTCCAWSCSPPTFEPTASSSRTPLSPAIAGVRVPSG